MTQQLDAAKVREVLYSFLGAAYASERRFDSDKDMEAAFDKATAELLALACPPVPGEVVAAAQRLRRDLDETFEHPPGETYNSSPDIMTVHEFLSARGADVRAADCMECGTCHDCVMRTMEASHAAHLEEVKQEGERVVAAILSRLGDVIRRIGPARRPDDIKAALEAIYNEYAHQSARAILSAGRAGDGWRPIAEAESLKAPECDDYLFYQKHDDIGDWVCIGHWAVTLGRWEFDGEYQWSEGLVFNPTHFRTILPPLGIAAEPAKEV